MTLNDLQGKLASRVERACQGAPVDPDDLEAYLDRARYEYSQYRPKIATFEFLLGEEQERVSVVDDLGNPAVVTSCQGVFLKQESPGTPYRINDPGELSIETPGLQFIDAKYRDFYKIEVSYYRNEHEFLIVRPRGSAELEGVIVYGTVREWSELPNHDERLILDYGVADFLQDHLVSEAGGLVRIPTPNGSFEFDGGVNLRLMMDKLFERFENRLNSRTSTIVHG